MEGFVMVMILGMSMGIMSAPSYAQFRTPCGASSMLTNLAPCIGFLTNASPNDILPTSQCCKTLKAFTSGAMDCLCVIVTGYVPFSIPINRTLATYLPQACNIPGVLLQCKSSSSTLGAPGPVYVVTSPSAPSGTPSPGSQGSSVLPRQSETKPLTTLASPPSLDSDTSSTIASGGHSQLTPSSSSLSSSSSSAMAPSYTFSPSFLLIALGIAVLNYY
ncbi:non-specific lipid-transfer protein-like protein [Senna tora]|uniref:Non-specific lipid-transfer protein-like protein n=1 Tax=Senna tora TaxID=362788 RepID=A0A835CD74_9FABA|nr:non-specific lipid-transfer protein-like protein [Senna tora]